jgi:ElaB/YqjD/DUF883 family membrane-anchored ribosome-binding protein
MTHTSLKTLSHDLQALADEAADHLKDAAQKTGSDATDAVARSTRAITRAADRLRDEAETAAARTRDQLSATVRDHPIAANLGSSVIVSLLVALAATFALTRFSQS